MCSPFFVIYIMTQKEIIYNIRNLVSQGRTSSFEKLSDRQLAFIIDYYRAFLIRNDIEKGRRINDAILQVFDLELTPDECETDFYFDGIPQPVELHHCDTITYVGYKGRQYMRLGANRSEFEGYSKYTHSSPKYWLEGLKLIVRNPVEKHNVEVHVKGIFQRPIDVVVLTGKWNPYDEFDFNYPIANNMLNQLYALVVSNELKITAPTVDTDNDA
jgi:hypothetical protein